MNSDLTWVSLPLPSVFCLLKFSHLRCLHGADFPEGLRWQVFASICCLAAWNLLASLVSGAPSFSLPGGTLPCTLLCRVTALHHLPSSEAAIAGDSTKLQILPGPPKVHKWTGRSFEFLYFLSTQPISMRGKKQYIEMILSNFV